VQIAPERSFDAMRGVPARLGAGKERPRPVSTSITVRARPSAVSEARRRVVGLLRGHRRDVVHVVELLVSELVSNSVRHAGLGDPDSIRIDVGPSDHMVRVSVCDPGPGFAVAQPAPRRDGSGGYGLYVLDRLADRWGVTVGPPTCVWFEIDEATA
jgi:anti-sigma regulatory factor (Ser/Thr protein kinase)